MKSFPEGETLMRVEYPVKKLLSSVLLQDESHVVAVGLERNKQHLFVWSSDSGDLVARILPKYPGVKVILCSDWSILFILYSDWSTFFIVFSDWSIFSIIGDHEDCGGAWSQQTGTCWHH